MEPTTTVREIKHRIRENTFGQGAAVLAYVTATEKHERIINIRMQKGQMQGQLLSTGKWVAILHAI